jgi:hypothetical protein
MDFDRRDPWEAAEAKPGREGGRTTVAGAGVMLGIVARRAVLRIIGGVAKARDAHEHRDEDEVDFAIVGTGAGGGTLACRLAEQGFSVVARCGRGGDARDRRPACRASDYRRRCQGQGCA